MKLRWLAVPALLVLASCSTSRTYGSDPRITLTPAAEMPQPTGAAGGYDASIGRSDTLVVNVVGFDALKDVEAIVDGRGNIVVPIAGSVSVGGLTTGAASEAIAQQLRRKFVRNPEVSVNFKEQASKYVTVGGSVTNPGNYPMLDGMTLTRAIAAARGFSDVARTKEVVVLRNVDGRQYAALYDVSAIERANYADPAIYPQDTILVGESSQRRLLQQLIQGAPLLVGPIVAVLQRN